MTKKKPGKHDLVRVRDKAQGAHRTVPHYAVEQDADRYEVLIDHEAVDPHTGLPLPPKPKQALKPTSQKVAEPAPKKEN